MATFGKPPPVGGTQQQTWQSNLKLACKFTAPEAGTITKLSCYHALVANSQNHQGVLYDDNAGTPNNLLANSASVMVDTTLQWWDFVLNYVMAAAEVLWLGVWCESFNSPHFYYDAGAVGQLKQDNSDAAPLDDPWVDVDSTWAREMSIYATYTPLGGLSIPVAMHHYGHHISKIIRG